MTSAPPPTTVAAAVSNNPSRTSAASTVAPIAGAVTMNTTRVIKFFIYITVARLSDQVWRLM